MALAVTPSTAAATASTTRNARVIEDPPCRADATSPVWAREDRTDRSEPDGRQRDPPPHRRAGGRGAPAGARAHRAGPLRGRAGPAGRPGRPARPLLGPAAPARRPPPRGPRPRRRPGTPRQCRRGLPPVGRPGPPNRRLDVPESPTHRVENDDSPCRKRRLAVPERTT